jgi:signal transduction histidine kinase
VIGLDEARSTAVFRILQEVLTNVIRHSNATRVDISLEQQGGDLLLKVADNGRGISEAAISDPKSLGILGMRERCLVLRGELEIKGIEGEGTTVTVRVPLSDLEAQERG